MVETSRTIKGYGVRVGYHDRCFLQEDSEAFSPLTAESYQWLRQHGGSMWKQNMNAMWNNTSSDSDGVTFYFDNPDTALLFKLTWGGQ